MRIFKQTDGVTTQTIDSIKKILNISILWNIGIHVDTWTMSD